MIAVEPTLGVKPSGVYYFYIIMSPVGEPITLKGVIRPRFMSVMSMSGR